MKEKYEKPDIIDQEKLDATSGAQDKLAYGPSLGFHYDPGKVASGNVPYTGGEEATFLGPLIAGFGALIVAGGLLVGRLSRRGARESSRNDDDVSQG